MFGHNCLLIFIAGPRYRRRCRKRHRCSGIQHFSPVWKYSGTELGLLIPVLGLVPTSALFSFRVRTDQMPDIPALKKTSTLLAV